MAFRNSIFDLNRLNLLIAVLEKRTKLNLSDKDIYVNVVGGLKLADFHLQFGFEEFPIVSCLLIIFLFVDCCNNIKYREPPLIVFIVPYRPYFTVVEETNRFFYVALYVLP